MQRILDPSRIEAFAHRSIPRVRLADPTHLFLKRAQRLRALGEQGVGQSIGGYLRLMAALADAQHAALATLEMASCSSDAPEPVRLPLEAARGPRDAHWHDILALLCEAIQARTELPVNVHEICVGLRATPAQDTARQVEALLGAEGRARDAATAPFVMAALQVYWTARTAALTPAGVADPGVPGICPTCGTLPVASVVRVDHGSQGYRYLHCPLCATEWHLVRVTCSQCQAIHGITYHSIEGGSEATRAEACDNCRSYRKIFYQEKDMGVEPVADDLASLALDLLMSEAGYHRASGNPLLWQRPDA
jgi:FdhE protein